MVDDLLFMIRKTREIVSPRIQSIAIPLSDNRLLLDDHVIYPNTPCTVVINKVQTEGCFYVSTTIKERSDVRIGFGYEVVCNSSQCNQEKKVSH